MPSYPAPEDVCRRVAELLREAREVNGLTMTVVAQRAGLSQQMVSYVERGMRQPTLDTLLRLERALGIDLADLLKTARRRK